MGGLCYHDIDQLAEGLMIEKEKALDLAIQQIEKRFGKGAVMKLGEDSTWLEVETISTGSLSLDLALGVGGIPRGRVTEIFGPESAGKSTLAFHIMAEAQKQGGIAAYIDVNTLSIQHTPLIAVSNWKTSAYLNRMRQSRPLRSLRSW